MVLGGYSRWSGAGESVPAVMKRERQTIMSSFGITDNSNRILRNTFAASTMAYIVSSLTTSLGSLIDGVVIGQFLGLDSMAAFGLASPVLIVFAVIGAILASGARNRFILKIGSGDMAGARGVFTLSMVLSAGTSILMMLVTFLFSTPICVMLGARDSAANLLGETRGYLLGMAIGLPAMNVARVLRNYMTVDNDRMLTVISSLVLALVDVVLDVLIAVMGGGTFGMGLATSISHYAGLGVLLVHFRRRERLTRFSLKDMDWRETGSMVVRGLPTGVGHVSNTLRTIILNHILAGTVMAAGCIAAYSVHRQADRLLNPFVFGISDSVITLAGLLVSEENRPMLKRLTKDYFAMIWTMVLGISVLFWFASPAFAALFIKDDPQALIYGIRAARSYAVGLPLYALNHAYSGYMEGRGKPKHAMVFTFLVEGAYLVICAMALTPLFHEDAIWYAFPACQVLQLLTIAGVIFCMNLKEKAKPKDFWDWFMALPNDFDVPDEDRIDRTISSHDEVIELSEAAWKFCREKGCDPRRCYAISLAVEELATNTVLTGFRPGHNNTIDMRILKKGDEFIVRIRDDCEIFDPVKQLQLYDRTVPERHIGLRIAIGSAKDVQYTTMLKLNNLVIRV